jgi:hypothetical protein
MGVRLGLSHLIEAVTVDRIFSKLFDPYMAAVTEDCRKLYNKVFHNC